MPLKNFRELTPEDVLALAINIEESNGTRLRLFAELFADYAPEAAAVFAEMASEEDEHHLQLETAYKQRYGELRRAVSEEDVQEIIEAHDLDDAEHMVFDDLSLRRVLETVLAAEHKAVAFYRQALEEADDEELGKVYRQLAEFEDGHVQAIEARLEALGESA